MTRSAKCSKPLIPSMNPDIANILYHIVQPPTLHCVKTNVLDGYYTPNCQSRNSISLSLSPHLSYNDCQAISTLRPKYNSSMELFFQRGHDQKTPSSRAAPIWRLYQSTHRSHYLNKDPTSAWCTDRRTFLQASRQKQAPCPLDSRRRRRNRASDNAKENIT